MLDYVQSICMLPGEQCIQCSEVCVQKAKHDAKDFQLVKLFSQQLKSRTNVLVHEDSIIVSMENFLQQNSCHNFAKAFLLLLPRVNISINVLYCNIYTNVAHHNKISRVAGATWNIKGTHPNTITRNSEYDVTLILLPSRKGQAHS